MLIYLGIIFSAMALLLILPVLFLHKKRKGIHNKMFEVVGLSLLATGMYSFLQEILNGEMTNIKVFFFGVIFYASSALTLYSLIGRD